MNESSGLVMRISIPGPEVGYCDSHYFPQSLQVKYWDSP
jgi:hypothetical protein